MTVFSKRKSGTGWDRFLMYILHKTGENEQYVVTGYHHQPNHQVLVDESAAKPPGAVWWVSSLTTRCWLVSQQPNPQVLFGESAAELPGAGW